ncbi:MAG: protease modulator HflC [Gammaproteobacteria bacterium]|jgi:membrane protease subunit HflC
MKIDSKNILLISLIIGSFLLFSLYTVYETDRVIILRLGKLVQDSNNKPLIVGPGLHIKWPFIDEIRSFDTRLNMLDIKSSRIVTSEKKDVLVDFYVEWKIEDLELFYTRTEGNKAKAEILLSQKSIDGLRAEFGRSTIKDVVSGTRLELMEKLRKFTDENAATLGIAVIDVRIKRIDLPDEVSGAVYERMRSERNRVASELKAKGEAEAIVIRANAEQKKRILLAEAEQGAKRIRGAGEAEASKIYAKAYEQAPQFFEFYRSLNAYKKVFSNKNDILVLKPESDFFKYFNSVNK